MLPSKLRRHLEATHPSVVKVVNQQKGSFYKQASMPSNALLASYKVAHKKEFVLPAAVDMVNIMIYECWEATFKSAFAR
jgi:hypothetical protein